MWQIVVIIFICWHHATGMDHRGQHFMLTFIENRNLVEDPEMRVYITSLSEPSTRLSVTVPILDMVVAQWSMEPETTEVVKLDVEWQLGSEDTGFQSYKSIEVEASSDIMVHAANVNELSSDAFLVLPVKALGTDYFIMSYIYTGIRQYGYTQGPSEFGIVTTVDRTNISFTFPRPGMLHKIRTEHSYGPQDTEKWVFLPDRGTAYQMQSSDDLTGVRITSTHPIVVISGTTWTSVGTEYMGDHLVEMLPPTSAWGGHYFTQPLANRSAGDVFRILAKEPDTFVRIQHSPDTNTIIELQQGQYYDFEGSTPSHLIANKGILLAQFCKSFGADENRDSDPFFVLVPPVEQYTTKFAFHTPSSLHEEYTQHYLNIVMPGHATEHLLLDGEPVHEDALYRKWETLDDTDYSSATIIIQHGIHLVTSSVENIPIGVVSYGFKFQESYGLVLGQKLDNVRYVCTTTAVYHADFFDNDCDGYIDEEIANGIDDDGDGLIDEDIYSNTSKRYEDYKKPTTVVLNPETTKETTEGTTQYPTDSITVAEIPVSTYITTDDMSTEEKATAHTTSQHIHETTREMTTATEWQSTALVTDYEFTSVSSRATQYVPTPFAPTTAEISTQATTSSLEINSNVHTTTVMSTTEQSTVLSTSPNAISEQASTMASRQDTIASTVLGSTILITGLPSTRQDATTGLSTTTESYATSSAQTSEVTTMRHKPATSTTDANSPTSHFSSFNILSTEHTTQPSRAPPTSTMDTTHAQSTMSSNQPTTTSEHFTTSPKSSTASASITMPSESFTSSMFITTTPHPATTFPSSTMNSMHTSTGPVTTNNPSTISESTTLLSTILNSRHDETTLEHTTQSSTHPPPPPSTLSTQSSTDKMTTEITSPSETSTPVVTSTAKQDDGSESSTQSIVSVSILTATIDNLSTDMDGNLTMNYSTESYDIEVTTNIKQPVAKVTPGIWELYKAAILIPLLIVTGIPLLCVLCLLAKAICGPNDKIKEPKPKPKRRKKSFHTAVVMPTFDARNQSYFSHKEYKKPVVKTFDARNQTLTDSSNTELKKPLQS